MRPHLQLLAPVVFSVVRDIVIPVKLAAEQAFLALFEVVQSGDTLFEVCYYLCCSCLHPAPMNCLPPVCFIFWSFPLGSCLTFARLVYNKPQVFQTQIYKEEKRNRP